MYSACFCTSRLLRGPRSAGVRACLVAMLHCLMLLLGGLDALPRENWRAVAAVFAVDQITSNIHKRGLHSLTAQSSWEVAAIVFHPLEGSPCQAQE